MNSPETRSPSTEMQPLTNELDPLHVTLVYDTQPPEPTSSPSPHQLRRRVFSLAAPVIGENLLQTLLGVVDTILVAGVGAVALAGVGAALQVIFVIIAALSALTVGASVLVAQAIGAGNHRMASSYARQSIVWSVVIAIPLTVLGILFTRPVIDLFGMQPDVVTGGRRLSARHNWHDRHIDGDAAVWWRAARRG